MTVEFGDRVSAYLEEAHLSKTEAAGKAGIDHGQFIYMTHGTKEIRSCSKIIALMNVLGVEPENQALFLLQSASVPESIAKDWLSALEKADDKLAPISAEQEMRRYIPIRQITTFARSILMNASNLQKVIKGDKKMGRELALRVTQNLAIPDGQRAQFFLTTFGFEFEDIRSALENYRNAHHQPLNQAEEDVPANGVNHDVPPERVIVTEEELIAAGWPANSIAVKWKDKIW